MLVTNRHTRHGAGAQGHGEQPLDSGVFGRVTLGDYLRFQAIHTRHHSRQLVPPG